ncbi:MAG: pseudaminic acid synthase [Saprospiraceae bacterium]
MLHKVFIIAELSANHGGNLSLALDSVRAAAKCGADAIKIQTYTADTITLDSDRDDFIIKGTIWEGKKLFDLYKDAYTPWEWHEEIFRVAKEEGLVCFSSPFDVSAVDFLESLNNPMYKIASFEITDIPLISYAANKQKPMIISTGIADYEDIKLAVDTCRKVGNDNITVLKCTSSYPAPIDEANLLLMQQFGKDFFVQYGLSDHTLGLVAPVVAATLGATMIEKHFILDRLIGGPDASFSLNVEEFTAMVQAVREAEKSLGEANYYLTKKQEEGKQFSRSLYVAEDIEKGDIYTEKNLRSVRPGYGMHPKFLDDYLGHRSNKSWKKGDRFIL